MSCSNAASTTVRYSSSRPICHPQSVTLTREGEKGTIPQHGVCHPTIYKLLWIGATRFHGDPGIVNADATFSDIVRDHLPLSEVVRSI